MSTTPTAQNNNSIQPQGSNLLTVDIVARALPPHLKRMATQSLVDQLNNISQDPELADNMRDNFISYTKVLQEGRFRIEDYLNAVKYVSFKLMGYSNKDAYLRTFPQRHAALVARGASEKDISAYVSMYAKGKLVNLIWEQTMIPTHVLNQDVHQKAINTLAEIMVDNDASYMARVTAANSLLTHLAKPKEVGPLINVDMRENSGVEHLKQMMGQLAKKQLELIQEGVPTKDIAAQKIIPVEST